MPEFTANSRSLRFVIIGAGLSGIMSAIKLAEAGYRDVTIYEKADRPGGTWRENTYPGVACDIPSHLYSYSFAPNPEWSRRYSPGHEIQAYLTAVARRFDVESRIRFSDEVERMERIDGRWHILTKRGHHDVADVVIAATGVTHHPKQPDLPGLSTFGGASFHSARWDHSVPLDGRRIGVIGSSSTAVQIVSALAERVSKLVLFQRTAQWILPQENPAYGDAEKTQFTQQPGVMQALRAEIARRFTDNFSNAVVSPGSPALKAIEDACRMNLESQVRDPVLREKLRPSYQAACKRLIVSFDFYQAVQKPAVEVVTDGIEKVEESGVRTRDGRLHELDLLVLATGFRVDRFLRPIKVIGRDGVSLSDAWAQRPQAYLSVAIPHFPNLFMLNGPNGPVGNFSLIEVAELQMQYILQLVALLDSGACHEISPTAEYTARFEAERVEATKNTVWASGCKSWYLDDRGVPSAWPWTIDRFRAEMSAPKLEAYEQLLRGHAHPSNPTRFL